MQSRPLDLDLLDTRLREVSFHTDSTSSRTSSGSSRRHYRTSGPGDTPTPPDLEALARDDELEAHDNLVNNGGRPLYPIHSLDNVSADAEAYAEMLLPWQNAPDVKWPWETPWGQQKAWEDLRGWEVFQRQWKRWQVFRRWQNDNRGLQDDYGGLPAYIESRKRGQRHVRSETEYASWLASIESDPSCFDPGWESEQKQRALLRSYNKEQGCSGFAEYSEAVTQRLARHGFTRPFQLEEDPRRQGELETWIEYLNFEYWWLDKFAESTRRLEPNRNKAWRELVDADVLRPHETDVYIRTDSCARQRQGEVDQARKSVEAAQSECARVHNLTQEDPRRLHIPKPKRIQMLRTASAAFHAAESRLGTLHKRNELIVNFIRKTFAYERAKSDAARQSNLVLWASAQVPLIEAALDRGKPADTRSPTLLTRRGEMNRRPRGLEIQRKRKLSFGADGAPGRQKCPRNPREMTCDDAGNLKTGVKASCSARSAVELDVEVDKPMSGEVAPKISAGQPPALRTSLITETYHMVPETPRRSARIAAHQQTANPDNDSALG